MIGTIFVDTNILVYARDSGQERKQQLAEQCLRQLWQQRTGRTSIQVLNEYYVTVTRNLKPGLEADIAWDDVHAFMSWNPQPIDRDILASSREIEQRYRTSWWGAMIVAAAQRQHCTLLLSEDFQDGMAFGNLTARNPFSTGAQEPRIQYRVSPRPRHRSRGRPANAV